MNSSRTESNESVPRYVARWAISEKRPRPPCDAGLEVAVSENQLWEKVEMVDKGNVDKHRRTYSNGVKAVEEMKWGADKARERYGAPKQVDLTVKGDPTAPQKLGDRNNLRGPGWQNDHKNDWVRGANETAENKPGYVRGKR